MPVFIIDDEILMKDDNGHIVSFNVNNFSTIILAENSTKVSFYYSLLSL